jgi:glycosyltransferase involved in cell wall biosynthesis
MARALIVSPFTLPHRGGVEEFVSWMADALRTGGYEPRIVTTIGEGDVTWPAYRVRPANIPIPVIRTRYYRQLVAEVREADIVLIQNFFWPLSWAAAEAARRSNTPALTIVHGNVLFPTGSSLAIRGISRAHAFTLARRQFAVAPPVAVSQSGAVFLREQFGVPGTTLPFPLDVGRPTRSAHEFSAHDAALRGVFAGRLVELKDPATAIRAVLDASDHLRPRRATLDVFGDGPLREGLERRYGGGSAVSFHGARPRNEVLDALVGAEFALSTSLTDNAQTSLLEALCLGVPVVATRVGDAAAYLDGPLAQLLVEPGDSRGVAEKMVMLARDYEYWESLCRSQATVLRQRHDPQLSASKLLALIAATS